VCHVLQKGMEGELLSQARLYKSDPAIQIRKFEFSAPIHAISEPLIVHRRRHPLLDDDDSTSPHSYHDYLFAAETLENIVNDGAFLGTIKTKYKWLSGPQENCFVSKEMSDRVLKLVYGTIKCNHN
jgi:hypothetical protein